MSAVNGFDVRQAIATISAGEYDDARSYIDVLELVVDYVGELSRTLLSLSFDWVELEPAAMARVLELAGRDEMLFDVRLEAQT